ncbi:MAG TPA: hypothetical protein VF809_02390 [Candidatus Saccharimonadales bacterium]
MAIKKTSFIYRFIRSLLPSPISALLCGCFGALIVGGYIVVQSISIGTSLPGIFEGEWGVSYTNNVVRPLLSISSNLTIGKVFVILLWGLAGLCIYAAIAYVSLLYKSWRDAQKNIQISGRSVVKHPGLHQFITAAAWRIAVTAVFAHILLIGVQPVFNELAGLAPNAVEGDLLTTNGLYSIFLLIIKISLLAHAFVVFARLMAMHARLFSDTPS